MKGTDSGSQVNPRLVTLLERAARYQERTVACIRAGRRPGGGIERRALEQALGELSAAVDCLRQAIELAEPGARPPLEAMLAQRETERHSLEAVLQRNGARGRSGQG